MITKQFFEWYLSLVSYFFNGRFEYQSWIFYGSQVTRKTGEILDSLQIIFFMIEFFVLQHKKENKLKSVT